MSKCYAVANRLALFFGLLTLVLTGPLAGQEKKTHDVVVYGGTSAGVTAAVQAARMDREVVLVHPDQHIGGLSSSGLGKTDTGNTSTIGGLSREFYQRVKDHYDQKGSWDEIEPGQYPHYEEDADTIWRFEPHVAELVFNNMLDEADVTVALNQRLDRSGDGVKKQNGRIVAIRTVSDRIYRGNVFIDATYEGDLMAEAGVQYTVGRESQEKYDERWAGVRKQARHHKHHFKKNVSPYVESGDPDSGLVPRVHGNDPGEEGDGDRRIQAYCFRMCMTKVEDNQVEWTRPDEYDPEQYELLFRVFEAGEFGDTVRMNEVLKPDMMPNRKTDTNNRGPFSTDNIGQNYAYPEASYAEREEIVQDHLEYQKGLMWTLAHHPRTPKELRKEVQQWGLAADEFQDNDHWPYKIYVREARRMVGRYVMTEHDCLGRVTTPQPIGMGSYTMDSHNTQRFITENGTVQNEGDIGVRPKGPYPIAYGSIVPKKSDAKNLLVPVCVSASHIAFGSIRMEPVFMILGQSAGTAAVHAIKQDVPVQDVNYERLYNRLRADGQRIPTPLMPVSELPGTVIDSEKAELKGNWQSSTSIRGYVGEDYLYMEPGSNGSATYEFTIPESGQYELQLSYTAHNNRSSAVPVAVRYGSRTKQTHVNQTVEPEEAGRFTSLGTYQLKADEPVEIVVETEGTDGYVVVDAVRMIRTDNESQRK